MLSWLPSFLRQLVLLAALLSFVCSDCNLFVSTGGGQRLSWEGELVSSTNADIYSASTSWCQRVLINISSSGVSSSFGLNSRNPHFFRRVLLAERKRRDGYYCRCRNVYTRNQGTAEREDIFLVVLRYHTGLIIILIKSSWKQEFMSHHVRNQNSQHLAKKFSAETFALLHYSLLYPDMLH